MIQTHGVKASPFSLSGVSTEGAGVGKKTIGKDQFLRLLTTQMQYQDPLNPMDGTNFTAQLAQFSSLEQLSQVNGNLESLKTDQGNLANLQTTNYLGKKVVTEGDQITVSGGSPSPAQYRLQSGAESGSLSIYDAEGTLVRVIELGRKEPGVYNVPWDGKDRNGNPVPDGEYRFQTDFYDEDNNYVPSLMYRMGTVQGVVFDSGESFLDLGGDKVPVNQVIKVY